ncbi:MAG TPA: hypothetical protein VK696_01080 [Steroidobacteraceae bacterium]|jgi:hypothetical protein|nr:hypothetical protein [Steroidobacteraceae bacterium]
MQPGFDSLRERLLRAGIAPRRVHRYLAELREHLADLTERERASGLDPRQAGERAMSLLGGDAELAKAMIDKGCGRSLAARAPWAVFVMSPLFLLVAALALNSMLMFRLLWPMQGLTPGEMPESYRALIDLSGVITNYLLGAVLSLGCIAVALRQRLESGWVWLGLGLIAVLTGLLGFHVHEYPAVPGHKAAVSYSLAEVIYWHERASLAASLGVGALRAVVLFSVAGIAYHMVRLRLVPDRR